MNPQRKFYSTEQEGRSFTLTVRERMRREAVKQQGKVREESHTTENSTV